MRRPLTAPAEQRQRRHFQRGVRESDPLALLPKEGIEQNFICCSAFVVRTGKKEIGREREGREEIEYSTGSTIKERETE